MNGMATEQSRHRAQGKYFTSPAEEAEADRLAVWLAAFVSPKFFQLSPGVQVVDGDLFRIRLLQDLREARHTALFSGALVRARQVYALFHQLP
ncbi:MAG: hypothetical protein NTY53_21815 [Kiritimatiellaeota bacterium]|nr:hypothetical protein [Kiritimatiellota bacterium]